jgi:hypothetical protein
VSGGAGNRTSNIPSLPNVTTCAIFAIRILTYALSSYENSLDDVGLFGPPFGHGQQEFYTIFPLSGTASHVLLE